MTHTDKIKPFLGPTPRNWLQNSNTMASEPVEPRSAELDLSDSFLSDGKPVEHAVTSLDALPGPPNEVQNERIENAETAVAGDENLGGRSEVSVLRPRRTLRRPSHFDDYECQFSL